MKRWENWRNIEEIPDSNPDHVKLVTKGRTEKGAGAGKQIVEWRRRNPKGRLELSDEILNRLYLMDCNMSGANMFGTWIGYSDLARVKLVNVDLREAQGYLTGLYYCDLSKARLTHAVFCLSVLRHCCLEQTDLTNLRFRLMTIVDCDLSKCVGLSTVLHLDATSIDVDTLTKSFVGAGGCFNRELRAFFTNAGIQKELLDVIPQILVKAKYCSCFVCYGEPDKLFAERLAEELKTHGVSCWMYSLDATPGKTIWGEIAEEMKRREKMIILCSAQSLVRDGVKKEIEKQKDDDPDRMIPISLDKIWTAVGFTVQRGNDELKTFLMRKTYADFSHPSKYNESLKKLLKGLEK